MRKSLKRLVAAGLAGVMLLGVAGGSQAPVWADSFNKYCDETSNDPSNGGDPQLWAAAGCDDASKRSVGDVAVGLINVVLSLVGLLAVVMIVVGGQRFLVANGDPTKIRQAKDMVLYALIGLAVTMLAFAIVNFVSRYVLTSASNTGTFLSIWG